MKTKTANGVQWNPRFTDTRLIRTSHHYGQFTLSLGKKSPYIFSTFRQPTEYGRPVNTKTFYGLLSLRINGLWLYSQFVLSLGWHFTWTIFYAIQLQKLSLSKNDFDWEHRDNSVRRADCPSKKLDRLLCLPTLAVSKDWRIRLVT